MKPITFEQLDSEQQKRCNKLEKTIKSGVSHFVKVGMALAEIRESKLYRDRFKTFEAYCQNKWKFTRMRAHQLIEAADVSNSLPKNVKNNFTNIAQLNALGKAPKEQREELAQQVIENTRARQKRMTSTDVEAVVMPHVADAPGAAPDPAPAQPHTIEHGIGEHILRKPLAAAPITSTTDPAHPTPAIAQADAQSEAGERAEQTTGFTSTPAMTYGDAAITTVADALAFCASAPEPGGNWETAAQLLAKSVIALRAELALLNHSEPFQKPAQLLTELQKFKPRIPDTMPQKERAKYGETINRMVIWLMNPVGGKNNNPYAR